MYVLVVDMDGDPEVYGLFGDAEEAAEYARNVGGKFEDYDWFALRLRGIDA